MTPERIKVIQKAGLPEGDGEHVNPYDFETDEQLTWGELRALLAAHGKTCEWVREDWANFKGDQFRTSCGRVLHTRHDRTRPCWCGGRVVIRGQKEK